MFIRTALFTYYLTSLVDVSTDRAWERRVRFVDLAFFNYLTNIITLINIKLTLIQRQDGHRRGWNLLSHPV